MAVCSVRRKVRLTGLFLPVVSILLLFAAVRGTLAQTGEIPLAISKSAGPDPARAGESLYFTLVVTNTGQTPLKEVFVRDEIPQGTTFEGSGHKDGVWATNRRVSGGKQEVLWQAVEPLAPGQAYRLHFLVTVASDAKGEIVNADYGASLSLDGPAVQGPPVVIKVGEPTATPSPTITPSPSPNPTHTPTTISPVPTDAPTSPPPPTPEPSPTAPAPKSGGGCPAAGGTALIGLGISFFRYKRNRSLPLACPVATQAEQVPGLRQEGR